MDVMDLLDFFFMNCAISAPTGACPGLLGWPAKEPEIHSCSSEDQLVSAQDMRK